MDGLGSDPLFVTMTRPTTLVSVQQLQPSIESGPYALNRTYLIATTLTPAASATFRHA